MAKPSSYLTHAKYRWVSRKGNKIQGHTDRKRKQIEAPVDFREYFTTKVLREYICKTATLRMHEDDENYKLTKVALSWSRNFNLEV
jgi:hypothetical protein